MPMPKKIRPNCPNCSKEVHRSYYKYCTNQCQADFRYKKHIQQWLAGEVTGLQGHGVVSRHVKRYLREKHGNKCCICSWSQVNIITGQVPLVADHIDGNWRNNNEGNLRLICPNCDSLTATYAGLNRGNGRKQRVVSKRAKEGRLLVVSKPE
jgi:endogenous inhibitor of DNA gyrase (YacG/DUF329 family)